MKTLKKQDYVACARQMVAEGCVLLKNENRALPIRKQDKVAVECTQDANFLIYAIACQLMGAVFVPLEKNASRERVNTIIEDTCPKLFVCENEYQVSVPCLKAEGFFSLLLIIGTSGLLSIPRIRTHQLPTNNPL